MTRLARHPLYRRHRFPLSLRMVDDMRAARGFVVSHQTVRLWAEKSGRYFANDIPMRSTGKLGDKWRFDEVVIPLRGEKHWLWRTVDQDGYVLDVLVQVRRDAKAAKRLMRELLKGQSRSHKGLNNRAENSHQPIRRRERIMKRFKSARNLQRFTSMRDPIANLCHIPRHDISFDRHRERRAAALGTWHQIADLQAA